MTGHRELKGWASTYNCESCKGQAAYLRPGRTPSPLSPCLTVLSTYHPHPSIKSIYHCMSAMGNFECKTNRRNNPAPADEEEEEYWVMDKEDDF